MPRTPPPAKPRPLADLQARDGFVAVGRVRGVHGVRGELKVEPLTDAPERFLPGATVHAGGVPRAVRSARMHRDVILLELAGIGTRERAAELRGTLLEVPEGDLPQLEEGRYYRHEIVGLRVFDQEGVLLGRVAQVLETGANDVYVTRSDEGDLLVPAIDSVITEIDVPGERIVVELLPGLERTPAKRAPRGRTPPKRASR